MDNNMVNNPEQPLIKNAEMNDSDYLNDMLATEKTLVNNYSIVLNEASNNFIYEEIINLCKDTHTCQRELYNILFKKGWYKLEKAEQQKINTLLQEHENKLNELPN